MEQKVALKADRYLTEKEASTLTGLSVAWFQRSRWSGGGPPFIKIARAVRYNETALKNWFDARTVSNTTQTASR